MEDIFADKYDYYIFQPLDYSAFEAHIATNNRNPELTRRCYLEWMDTFYQRSNLFYLSQFERQARQADREFREMQRLNEDDGFDELLQEEWEKYYNRTGLKSHEQEFKACREEIKRARADIEKKRNGAHILLDMLDNESENRHRAAEINALWFDMIISNSSQTRKMLRSLPYEIYLKTKHWAKVRAAQMLIHKAVCQEQSHYDIGESWYTWDWETDIHVHHLTYDNIGNERYSDLVLLCASHHSLWHREVEAYGSSSMLLADDA